MTPTRYALAPNTLEFGYLHHAIGAPKHQAECSADPWRNHFYANNRGADAKVCEALVAAGLMIRGQQMDEYAYYHVTQAGIDAVRACLPVMQRWTVVTELGEQAVWAPSRSKARARVVDSIRDAWNCTWREALGQIRSVRRAVVP